MSSFIHCGRCSLFLFGGECRWREEEGISHIDPAEVVDQASNGYLYVHGVVSELGGMMTLH